MFEQKIVHLAQVQEACYLITTQINVCATAIFEIIFEINVNTKVFLAKSSPSFGEMAFIKCKDGNFIGF